MLDVFFISMGEPGCENNWKRLQEFVPAARRVDNIKGIYNVHATCAKLSRTENFWVVDADAWILDGFDFSWEPDLTVKHHEVLESDCVIIWPSRNPVNGLEYGYGAVKVFPRQPFIDGRDWSVDMTSSVAKVIVSKDVISCETRFNNSAETAWIGAFRECAKLASLSMIRTRIRRAIAKEQDEFDNVMQFVSTQPWTDSQKLNYRKAQNALISEKYRYQKYIISYWEEMEIYNRRLLTWCTVGEARAHGRSVIKGAQAGAKFGLTNSDDTTVLNLINDWNWLKEEYTKNVNV